MIVKVFKVHERRNRTGYVRVQRWRGVSGKRNIVGLAERRDFKKSGDTAAACNIGLLQVDSSSCKHVAEVKNVIAILASGNVHHCWSAITHQPQTFKIVRRDRLFKPAYAETRKPLRLCKGLFAAVSAIGIHVQRSFLADCMASYSHALNVACGIAADLHLHARDTLAYPAGELLCKLSIRIRGKAATAIYGRSGSHLTQQCNQRKAEQLRFQVPQGAVNG